MTVLVDLGNTRLKCARLDGTRVHDIRAFVHAQTARAAIADLAAWLDAIDARDDVLLASVAREDLANDVTATFEARGCRVRRVRTRAATPTLRIAYADPSRLGVDRWLAMLAARARGEDAVLVAGVGSALTVDAIDANGQHLGGLIAPAPEAMRESLFARAPHLRGEPAQVHRFATDTADAVTSGSLLAGAALIERSWQELATRLHTAPRLLLSGGGVDVLRPWLPAHEHVPHLVLDGLAAWIRLQDTD